MRASRFGKALGRKELLGEKAKKPESLSVKWRRRDDEEMKSHERHNRLKGRDKQG